MKAIFAATFILFSFMSFMWVNSEDQRREKVFEVYSEDSVLMEIELVYDEQGYPEQYFSHINTPVCKDSLCDIVVIDLYWDLLGNFKEYQVPSSRPLTKFDHEEFTEEDYQKLHKILADKRSLLEEYQIEDLIDENTELVSKEVDAVTGATKKTVEKAVVGGAVYSTYVLWHIVNGEIPQKIINYTESLWDDSLLENFLHSDNYHYHYYALDHIPPDQYQIYMPAILRLIEKGSVFVAQYAIEKLPAAIFEDKGWQLALVQQYDQLSYRLRGKMIQRLQQVNMYGEGMDLLSQQLDALSESQLKEMMYLFIKNEASLHENTVDQIVELIYHDNPIYAEKGYQALKELSLKNKMIREAIKNYKNNR